MSESGFRDMSENEESESEAESEGDESPETTDNDKTIDSHQQTSEPDWKRRASATSLVKVKASYIPPSGPRGDP